MGIALLLLGGVAGIVGFLMLCVAAFRTSVLWGLAFLFVPFAGLVYVIAHWEEARTGFFLNLGGFAVAALGWLFVPDLLSGGGLAMASWREPSRPSWEQPARPGPRQDPPGGPGARPGFGREGFSPSAPGPGPGSAQDDPSVSSPQPQPGVVLLPRREEVLSPWQAGAHLGRMITIVPPEGKAFKARLRAVAGGVLILERPMGGGSVTFAMPMDRIREVRVSPASR